MAGQHAIHLSDLQGHTGKASAISVLHNVSWSERHGANKWCTTKCHAA